MTSTVSSNTPTYSLAVTKQTFTNTSGVSVTGFYSTTQNYSFNSLNAGGSNTMTMTATLILEVVSGSADTEVTYTPYYTLS